MGRVEGKVVVVTGAAGGQGAAEARALAREGATVVATDLHEQDPRLGDGIAYRRLDVARAEDWSMLGTWLRDTHGRVDGLVNNAGIPFRERLAQVAIADWDRVIGVNLTGVWLSVRAVLPAMMRTGGSIVTQSSTAGLVGVAGLAAYSAAKGGVIALTRQLAVEYGRHGIRANAICPGTVWTPLVERTLAERGLDAEEAMASAGRGYPLKRFGTPEEVAAFALFLASDESAWITGGAFAADGGYTAR
jgi:NAD(P)-dependent dehydrogenase (short-subunit alcohol dehydrogenase family)